MGTFKPRFPGSIEKITEKTVTFGQKTTFDLDELSNIITDFGKNNLKAYIGAVFFRVQYSVTVPGGSGATLYNTRRQRGCIVVASINQPKMEYSAWEGQQPLTAIDDASAIANLPMARMAAYLSSVRGAIPPALVTPSSAALANAEQPSSSLFAASAFDEFGGGAVALNSTGAPVVQEVDDVFAWAPMLASQNPEEDYVSADALANPDSSTQFYITVANPAASLLFGPGATMTGGATTCTVELWAWIRSARVDKDSAVVGLPWAMRMTPREGPLVKMDPLRSYRWIGCAPEYDNAETDTGVRFYLNPHDWPDYGDESIRWQTRVNGQWKDVYPFTISSSTGPSADHVVNLWNDCNARGWTVGVPRDSIAPMVWLMTPGVAHSNLSDRMSNSTAYADVGMGTKGFGEFVGRHSFQPHVPYACTDFANPGFAGFPGDNVSECEPRTQWEPDNRPTELQFEVWANPAGQQTFINLDGGISCGCSGKDGAAPQFLPDIKNPTSPSAVKIKNMVPLVADGAVSAALAQLTPQIPPAVKGTK